MLNTCLGIAALSVTFLLTAKRKVTKRKLPAAPASFNGSALTSGVVAEPDDAGFGRLTVDSAFLVLSKEGRRIFFDMYSGLACSLVAFRRFFVPQNDKVYRIVRLPSLVGYCTIFGYSRIGCKYAYLSIPVPGNIHTDYHKY